MHLLAGGNRPGESREKPEGRDTSAFPSFKLVRTVTGADDSYRHEGNSVSGVGFAEEVGPERAMAEVRLTSRFPEEDGFLPGFKRGSGFQAGIP